jgi:6-phosphofructokinase
MSKKAASKAFKVFVSYCVDDKKFVYEVRDLLIPYLGHECMYLFEDRPQIASIAKTMMTEVRSSHYVIVFVGKRFDQYMQFETLLASAKEQHNVCIVCIGGQMGWGEMPPTIQQHITIHNFIPDNFTDRLPPGSIGCAQKILQSIDARKDDIPALKGKTLEWDDGHLRYGLPATPHIFDYEKDMIRFYAAKRCYEQIVREEDERKVEALKKRYASTLSAWSKEKVESTLGKGIAADWPPVFRYAQKEINPLKDVDFRSDEEESLVRAAALVGLDPPGDPFLFPEAGPRQYIALPAADSGALKAAIVVAGGIAPGINAVIDAIVQRHYAYHNAAKKKYQLRIIGFKNGLLAIEHGRDNTPHIRDLEPKDTIENATRGGSMLGTSRDEMLLDSAALLRSDRIRVIADELRRGQIDVLYVIGGDGSMKAAHALWHKANSGTTAPHKPISVVAIPKTMDNDILWVWQSFGFLSAVEEAREIVERLHTEVRSNPRLGIVQFFGSGSGFVVSHAVLAAATGHAILALIPEMDFSVIGVARYLKNKLWKNAGVQADPNDPAAPIDPSIPHGLIVMAETAIPVDAMECLGIEDPPEKLAHYYQAIKGRLRPSKEEEIAIREFFKNGRRVQGQTSDDLRSLGIKILREALPVLIKDKKLNELIEDRPGCPPPNWEKMRMVRNEPRYLVRALEPSTSDIITGQRLGLLAVDAAMAGYTDCMISQWLTEFAIVPLGLVVIGRKRIPPNGMFWKSVIAKTQQLENLVHPYPKSLIASSKHA